MEDYGVSSGPVEPDYYYELIMDDDIAANMELDDATVEVEYPLPKKSECVDPLGRKRVRKLRKTKR